MSSRPRCREIVLNKLISFKKLGDSFRIVPWVKYLGLDM